MAHPRTGSTPVPREERALDPRAIARASLHASRNASLWWTSAGVGLATVVALVVGTQAGAWALAALAAACAVLRAVLPSPGPVAIAARAKPLDVAVLALLAVALTALGAILPTA
jgi:hypothetical protein